MVIPPAKSRIEPQSIKSFAPLSGILVIALAFQAKDQCWPGFDSRRGLCLVGESCWERRPKKSARQIGGRGLFGAYGSFK